MMKLIGEDGSLNFGFSETPVGRVNYQDFPLRDRFRRPLPVTERERQFIHFHFLGFTSDRFIAGCSLTLANQQPTVFFYIFDRQTGHLTKRGCRIGASDTADINLDPDNGLSVLKGKGMEVRFTATPDTLAKRLTIILDGTPTLDMQFAEKPSDYHTLRLTTPTGPNGWTYAQKVAGLAATGTVTVDGKTHDLASLNATAHHDFTAGFLRPDTFWNWCCITGKDSHGRLIGLNLSHGVNETGHSENAVWVDGKREAAGLISFDYDLDDLTKPWRITSDTGRITLDFHSDGAYTAYHTEGPTPVDFHQLFGTFNGEISSSSGENIKISKIPGFCERQFSVWWC